MSSSSSRRRSVAGKALPSSASRSRSRSASSSRSTTKLIGPANRPPRRINRNKAAQNRNALLIPSYTMKTISDSLFADFSQDMKNYIYNTTQERPSYSPGQAEYRSPPEAPIIDANKIPVFQLSRPARIALSNFIVNQLKRTLSTGVDILEQKYIANEANRQPGEPSVEPVLHFNDVINAYNDAVVKRNV